MLNGGHFRLPSASSANQTAPSTPWCLTMRVHFLGGMVLGEFSCGGVFVGSGVGSTDCGPCAADFCGSGSRDSDGGSADCGCDGEDDDEDDPDGDDDDDDDGTEGEDDDGADDKDDPDDEPEDEDDFDEGGKVTVPSSCPMHALGDDDTAPLSIAEAHQPSRQ